MAKFSRPFIGFAAFLCVIVLFFCSAAFAGAEKSRAALRPKRVLMVASYHLSQPWTGELITAFREQVRRFKHPVVLDVATLDAAQNEAAETQRRFRLLLNKIRAGYYDLVIAADDDAVQLMFEHYRWKPAHVPFVFCGYENYHPKQLDQYPNMTGVVQQYEYRKTFAAALRLLPGTRRIFVVSDASPRGCAQLNRLRRAILGMSELENVKISFIDNQQFSSAQIVRKLASLPEDALVLMLPWYNLVRHGYLSMESFGMDVRNFASRPVFGVTRQLIGNGTLGGYIARGNVHAAELAEIVRRVLARGSADGVLPVVGRADPVFDYRDLTEKKLDVRRLPEGTLLLHRPRTLFETHPRLVSAAAAVVLLVIAISIGYILLYRRIAGRNFAIYRALPVRVGVLDRHMRILFVAGGDKNTAKIRRFRYFGSIPGIDHERVDAAFQTVFRTGSTISLDYANHHEKRSMTISPLPVKVFGCAAAVWLSHDNSELQNARHAADVAAERLRITLASIGDGVIATDADGIVTLMNETASRLVGRTMRQAIGRPVGKVFRVERYPDGAPVENPVERAIRSGKVVELADHTDLVSRDHLRYHIADSAAPIREKDGTVSGAVLVFRDVSEEYEQRDRIRFTLQALQHAAGVADISYFVYSEDDRSLTPLAGIRSLWRTDDAGRALAPEEWLDPVDVEPFRRKWKQLLAGESEKITVAFRSRGVNVRHFRMFASPLAAPQPLRGGGSSRRFLGIIQDVTELAASRRETRDAVALMDSILLQFPASVFVKDVTDDFRYVVANAGFVSLFREGSGILGRSDFDIFPERVARAKREADLAVVEHGSVLGMRDDLTDAAGRERAFITGKSLFRRSDGHTLLIGVSTDISNEFQLEKERDKLIRRLNNYIESEQIINRCLSRIVLEERFERNLEELLQTILQQLNCDRALFAVFRADAGGAPRSEVFREAHARGLGLAAGDANNRRMFELFTEWRPRLERGELIVIPDAGTSEYASRFETPPFRSLICAPVFADDKLIGLLAVGFVRERRSFTDVDDSLMRAAAKLVTLARENELQHRRLREARDEKIMILNNVEIPIWLYDTLGNLTFANPAVLRLSGLAEKTLLSQPCAESFHCDFREKGKCPVMRAIASGAAESCSHRLNGRDYIITANPIFGEDGSLRNVVKSAFDVTEINETSHKLEQALVDARAADRAKSFFLATMSHELRTPLNAVIGFSELLQDNKLERARALEYIRSINLAGTSLLGLVNDVLDLSKLEAGRMDIRPERVSLGELCHEMMAVFSLGAERKKIELKLSMPKDLPELWLDRLRLRQVLLNLIGNALKFTEKGYIGIIADFRRNGESGTLVLAVSDTGMGVRDEDKTRIFEPFVQQDHIRGTLAGGQGTGLGLTISRRMVERMGGVLELQSAENVGSTFTITLDNVRCADASQPEASPGEPRNTAAPASPGNVRVLLVDDVPMNLRVLEAMLKKLQCGCLAASTASEALELLEASPFDLVLSDMWMPGMNGAELAAHIRADRRFDGTAIAAVTADIEAGNNFPDARFDAVLLKPVTLERLRKFLTLLASGGLTRGGNVMIR